jgi:Na+/H+ antiporter NhaC
MAQERVPARFQPLRISGEATRLVAFTIGPFVWLIALVVLAVVINRRDAVELAVIVAAASFGVGVVVSVAMRRARVRQEGEP